MCEAFGFSGRVLKEAYWVNETSFRKPDDKQSEKIARGGDLSWRQPANGVSFG